METMMSEELKPCPFCGDSQFSTMDMTYMHESGSTKGKRIKCQTCGAQAPDGAWNHRAELAALKAGQGEAVAWIKPDVLATLRADECCYAFGQQDKKKNLIPLYTAPPASADARLVPVEFVRFLLGEADLNGYSFGDMHQVRVGKFWWRTELRALLAQTQGVKS